MYCSVASIGHADIMWSIVSSNYYYYYYYYYVSFVSVYEAAIQSFLKAAEAELLWRLFLTIRRLNLNELYTITRRFDHHVRYRFR